MNFINGQYDVSNKVKSTYTRTEQFYSTLMKSMLVGEGGAKSGTGARLQKNLSVSTSGGIHSKFHTTK